MFRQRENEAEQETVNLFIKHMGEGLGSTFGLLYYDTVHLSILWNEYKVLFGSKKSVDILNKSCPTFAHLMQITFRDRIMLLLTRFHDDQKFGVKQSGEATTEQGESIVFKSLLELINDPFVRGELLKRINTAKSNASFIREYRNKKLVHLDKMYNLIADKAQKLPVLKHSRLEKAINAHFIVVQYVLDTLTPDTFFIDRIHVNHGAKFLLRDLEAGKYFVAQPGYFDFYQNR